MALENPLERGSLYVAVAIAAAVREVLKQDFELSDWKPPERDNDFLHYLGRELEIEANEGRPAQSGGMP